MEKHGISKVRWVVPGGDSALASQFNGLSAIRRSRDYTPEGAVLIHDGVRPLIDEKIISDCLSSVEQFGSGVTVAPAIETIIRVDDNRMITDTVPRSECQLARAPQAFRIGDIIGIHEQAKADGCYSFVDSTSMMLHYGKSVRTVEGPSENIKVTNPADFYICRALLDAKENSQIYGI